MPSGYTYDITKNPSLTAREFILRCARAFGACIMQRDDDIGEPPKRREPDRYHDNELKKAVARLGELLTMSNEQAQSIVDAEYTSELVRYDRDSVKCASDRASYARMRSRIAAWSPPTSEHENLKKFMLEQIDESARWDCHDPERPVKKAAEEWLEAERERARWDIEYHSKHAVEERARCKEANDWIDALYASLP